MKAQIATALSILLFSTSAFAETVGYPTGCTPQQRGCGPDKSRVEKATFNPPGGNTSRPGSNSAGGSR